MKINFNTCVKSINSTNFQSKRKSDNSVSVPKNRSDNTLLLATLMTLASLSPLPTNAYKAETDPIKIEIVAKYDNKIVNAANMMKLSSTANDKIYYDEKKGTYYVWDDNEHKFKKAKEIKTVFKTGFYKTKKGEYFNPEFRPHIQLDRDKKLYANREYGNVPSAAATAYGYEKTSLSEYLRNAGIDNCPLEVYYDSETQKYKKWDTKRSDFIDSPITEVNGLYFKKENKPYKLVRENNRYTEKEVSKGEYNANKMGLIKASNKKEIFRTPQDSHIIYYQWNSEKDSFDTFGDEIDMQKMLKTKAADEKELNFRQGDIGDCWLMSVLYGMNYHPNEVLRERAKKLLDEIVKTDDNDNVIVNLRGIKKQYTIPKEDIDSVLTHPNYHYSLGSRKIVGVEMAMENYKRWLSDNAIDSRLISNMYNMNRRPINKNDKNMALDGGQAFDAVHILSGMEAHYLRPYNDSILYKDNEIVAGKLDEKTLAKYLDDNLVMVNYKEPSGLKHVVFVAGMDDKNVYVMDSNIDDLESDKTVRPHPVNKEFLFDNITGITYTDLSTPISESKSKSIKANFKISSEVQKMLPAGTVIK